MTVIPDPVLSAPFAISWGFDCLGANVQYLSAARPGAIWPYVSGGDGIPWTEDQIRYFAARGAHVYRVNQGYVQGPGQALHGDEYDFEAGAWTIGNLLEIVAARRRVKWSTRIYCSWSSYGTVKQMLAEAGTGKSVFFRIADWNLDEHLADLELHADVYAGQWASPTSHPLVRMPGTGLTLAQANADLSVVLLEYTGWLG
jgi:hypothetical protein